jgi:hypothetical protein
MQSMALHIAMHAAPAVQPQSLRSYPKNFTNSIGYIASHWLLQLPASPPPELLLVVIMPVLLEPPVPVEVIMPVLLVVLEVLALPPLPPPPVLELDEHAETMATGMRTAKNAKG